MDIWTPAKGVLVFASKMQKLISMVATMCALAFFADSVRAETYIKIPRTGAVTPKHECSSFGADKPCVDCTFLDYRGCYEQADKLGLVNKNHPRLYLNRAEEPLEWECNRSQNATTTSMSSNNGVIICPVPGAVAVDAPHKPTRLAQPWLPEDTADGNAAIGIFFTQHCPGYLTPAARETIHTFSQFRAREAWTMVDQIETNIVKAAGENQTNAQKELYEWCKAAESRVFAIQEKLGQALR
jgi:hypothetical protein